MTSCSELNWVEYKWNGMLHHEFSYNKCEMRQSTVTKQHPQTNLLKIFRWTLMITA